MIKALLSSQLDFNFFDTERLVRHFPSLMAPVPRDFGLFPTRCGKGGGGGLFQICLCEGICLCLMWCFDRWSLLITQMCIFVPFLFTLLLLLLLAFSAFLSSPPNWTTSVLSGCKVAHSRWSWSFPKLNSFFSSGSYLTKIHTMFLLVSRWSACRRTESLACW